MSEPRDRPVSETSATLDERARGGAERAVLGRSPISSLLRIVLSILGFILIAGGIFYWLL